MSQSQSSSFCNIMLEQSDLKKLEQLDPFQTDGFQSISRISIPVKIIYTNEIGKQTIDRQNLTFQILTRWIKSNTTFKSKDPKSQPQLDCVRICISSEIDIFLSFVCNFNVSSFEALKVKNKLNLNFNDFPSNLISILKNCSSKEGISSNNAEFHLSYEGTGKVFILHDTEYKQIELLELFFTGTNLQKSHQSIIYRYNYNRTKLAMIENSIDSIYKLLANKNPPLLAFIQKTVGVEE